MEEHEVYNLYRRISFANLEIGPVSLRKRVVENLAGVITKIDVTLDFFVINTSKAIEKDYKLEIHLPKEYLKKPNRLFADISRQTTVLH